MYSEHAIVTKTLDDLIVDWSPGACQLLGYEKSEVLGKRCSLLIPSEAHFSHLDTLERLGQGQEVSVPDAVLIHRDGRRIAVRMTESPVRGPAGNVVGAVVVAHDLADTGRLDPDNVHMRRLAAIGRLADGVAHKFNNLLTAILGHTDLLKTRFCMEDAGQTHLDAIHEAVQSATALTERILDLGRRANNPPPVAAPVPPPAADMPCGLETILLVEDHDMLRLLNRSALERQGYTVLEAADGEAALLLLLRHPLPIDLAILDVMMPNLGGPQLADRLSTLRPNIKVIFTSGYTPDVVAEKGCHRRDFAFLQKPYTQGVLTRIVRQILDARRPHFRPETTSESR